MELPDANSWTVVSLSPHPAWLLWSLGGAAVAGLLLAGWGLRREPALRRRLWLLAPRVVACACVLVFLLEPGLREVQVARARTRVAVLVDRSASMGFPVSPGAAPRAEAVRAAVERRARDFEALAARFAVDWFAFDGELASSSPTELARPPTGKQSDLLGALRALAASDEAAARKLSGVLVFSDGADHGELATEGTGRARGLLERWGVPVSTVAVGEAALKDLSVEAVRADDFAFVRNALTVDVDLRARGFAGETVPVVLRREGRTVASKPVTFDGPDVARRVSFTFTPDDTGRFVYTVALPSLPGEAVAENNTRAFVVKVIRDRVRVLFVAGRPSWDERFLRGHLKQDANVDLVSFYILRNTFDDVGADDRELSLIPFPKQEIFREKLHTFDLVLMVDFGSDEREIGLTEYQEDLRRYVRGGGALAFVGGAHALGPGARPNPFADVLPLESAGSLELEPFRVRVTEEGRRHPMLLVAASRAAADEVWAAMPELPGLNLTRARPGATVLLEHPFRVVEGRGAPLVAVWEHGRGRVLAVATDGTWRWAFRPDAAGEAALAWGRFWGNAIRWLVRDPELTTLSVKAEASSVEPGSSIVARLAVRRPDYQPAAGAGVTVELVAVDDGRTVERRDLDADADGALRVELQPPAPGAYKVIARASLEPSAQPGAGAGAGAGAEAVPLESSDVVAVRATGPELGDPRVDRALLGELARASGGRYFELDALRLDEVPWREPPLVEVGRSRERPLWDRWYWLAAAAMALGLEWVLRRRFGHP